MIFKRKKKKDQETLQHLHAALVKFLKFKKEKWEKIDETVQASNLPGTPTEDWIIPPDEMIASDLLMGDPQYKKLKGEIESLKPEALEIGAFLDFHLHALEWLSFNNPLIGNEALEDAIAALNLLIAKQKGSFYLLERIKALTK